MPVIVIVVLMLFCISLMVSADGVILNVWMDRDLSRAADYHFLTTVQGPEATGGQRSPGGGYYALLAAVFAIAPDIVSAALLQAVMLGLACLLLAGFVYKISGNLFQAMATVTVYATSGAFRDFQTFWNPGFIPLFTVLLTALLYQAAESRKAGYVGWFLLALSFSMQIHQQVLLFLPVAVLVCAIYRPVWSRWSLILAIAAIILPIAPYILHEFHSPSVLMFRADRSVWDTPYVSSQIISLDWLLDRFGVLFALGADNASSVDGLLAGRSGSLLTNLFRLHDVLVILLVVVGGVIVVRKQRPFSGQKTTSSGERLLIVLSLSIVVVALLVLASSSVTTDRHIVFAAPAFAMLTGWIASGLVRMIPRDHFRAFLATLLYLMMALKILFFALIGFTGSGNDPSRYAGAKLIHDYIATRLGWSYEMTAARLSVFNGRSGVLITERLPFGAFFRLPSSMPTDGDGYKGCLAVVSRTGTGKPEADEIADLVLKHPHIAQLTPVSGAVDETEDFYFVRYQGLDGNCLKAATNAYLYRDPSQLSEMTAGATQFTTGQGDSKIVWRSLDDTGRHMPLWIGMMSGTDGLQPILDGRELRGHTGFVLRKLEQPYIEFRDVSGRVIRRSASMIPFVGGRYDNIGTMAPWHLPAVALPTGRYSLTLGFTEKKVPKRIDLGQLEVSGQPENPVIQWQD